MSDKKYAFIGLGLIGGSIAKAIRHMDREAEIILYDYHAAGNKADLMPDSQPDDGVVNHVTGDLNDLSSCNYIFLCAPVLSNSMYLEKLKPVISSNVTITDVGSVKGDIVNLATKLGLAGCFVGGHPMTGSELTGYANSNMKILENAYYIITPCNCEASRKKALELEKLVSSMHAIPLMLDAGKHDEAVSAISHVPHLIAASLVELVRENDDENETMRLLAAGGFKDITRIAQSSPKMWHDICVSNASAITETLSKYISMLIQIRDNIKKGNAGYITELFENSGSYRSSIPNSKGILNRYYEIYLDIADETGAIATIAALLAQNSISIKNIGIIHNREFENGVLRIELYDEKDKVKSMSVLREKSYRIYDR